MATTADLLNLHKIGQRQCWFEFAILDRTLAKIDAVKPVKSSTITISNDTTRATMRSLTGFELASDEGAAFEEVGARIQPWMVLENGDKAPLGVFLFVDARRVRSSRGIPFQGSMSDLTFVVDQQSEISFGVNPGDLLQDAVAAILTERGVPSFVIDPTGVVCGSTPIGWPAGTSWLRIVNELAAKMGCLPLYFGPTGQGRVRVAPNLAAVDPAVTYEDGLNIYDSGIAEWNDILTAPNLFVVVDTGSNSAPIRGTFEVPPSAPNSVARTDVIIPYVHTEQGLLDSFSAAERARVLSITEGAVFEHVAFEGAPDWRHGTFDVIDFRGERWLERSWSMPLSEGAPMTHELARIYS